MSVDELVDIETARVAQLADELRAEGYDVEVGGLVPGLAPGLGGYGPDLVATRGTEGVAYKVAVRGAIGDAGRLSALSAAINERPGWRFQLVVLPPVEDGVPDPDVVVARAQEARELAERLPWAALLIAWVALEGAVRILAARRGERVGTASGYLSGAYSRDVLSEQQYRDLTDSLTKRNRVTHGFDTDVAVTDVVTLADAAEWLSSADFVPVAEMIEWFFDEYEGPEQHVPHDSREGGFQYYKGGPQDARDALEGRFPNAPVDSIEEAVELIEAEGGDWVRKGQYP